MIVLVDTCVWSLAFRRRQKHTSIHEARALKLLTEIISEGRAQMLGLVRQELLSGIRDEMQFDRIAQAARSFPDITLEVADYEEAAKAYNLCRRAGVASTPADLLLCAAARRRNWAVLSTDKDFPRYQKSFPFMLLSGH